MKDEITEFFGNLKNITDFSIRKWIYQQTNNLDANLFCGLSSEFNLYCMLREVEETNPPKNNDRLVKNDNDYFNSLPLNYYKIEDNIIQYNRIEFANKIDYDHWDLIRVFSTFQNIMHELFEIIKSKETTTAPPQQNEIVNTDEVKKSEAKEIVKHPEFDTNLWNKDCFDLFKYIYDHYYKKSKRELTNIWFYLKDHTNDTFVLKATKDEYIEFIFENYHIKITNFDKAENKWNEKELPTLKDHNIDFKDTLK